MKIVADLHIHSKYSRAVSQQMVIPEIAKWADKKGIDLVGTGDFTHPLWFRELKSNLEEENGGIFKVKNSPATKAKFLLTSEISSIYSQGGKTRRIHNLILAPSFETVDKIIAQLQKRGANLMSDGRPIIGMSSRDLTALVLSVDVNSLVIPAHCLLPFTMVHLENGIKRIDEIKTGEKVYTHKNHFRKVTKTFIRPYKGKIYKIISDYFCLGISVTSEHPFFAIKTKSCPSFLTCRPSCSAIKKCCARKYFKSYQPGWVKAQDLKKGDILIYPRFTQTQNKEDIRLSDYLFHYQNEEGDKISYGGTRKNKIKNRLKINKKFCYLVGLYLAEGYTSRDLISFTFHKKEAETITRVKKIVKEIFGINKFKEYQRKDYQAIELTFYSKILYQFFSIFFYNNQEQRKAYNKCLPTWMLKLPIELQKEILIGWWEGDKGYTTSRLLMNQLKIICLRLGIIPSIGKDSKDDHKKRGNHNKFENREIIANRNLYYFSNLSFFEDKFNLLKNPLFFKYKTRLSRRRGWMDDQYIYLPIRMIKKEDYQGNVYNLEVKNDNSYTTEFACVHNCWTPWFSLYGSMSGFDSLDECYSDMSQYIYGIETGLSSDPAMNWRIKELDNKSILSSSDAHSGAKLGREATVFEIEDPPAGPVPSGNRAGGLRYENIRQAIFNRKIAYTIEFYPEEGKYHYTGHRNCHVRQSPEETKKLGTTCPVCGKPLTVGVMHRVEQLSKQLTVNSEQSIDNKGVKWISYNQRPSYMMLVPLMEIIAEAESSLAGSQKVTTIYENLVNHFGSEFKVLLETPIEEIKKVAGEKVGEGIKKVRSGEIVVEPGYDGEFGVVKIWGESGKSKETGAKEDEQKQMSLF